ncbi:hypothetical protein [Streptomyces sp. SID13726]|uniref:hypothetical protein n=1 Tax=Streptomyces sp. SID13726 TaxID=2706058 RepID=UPI0013B9A529|nr:hypothetical protein [Streptomyces sp. SID13726]NEB02079.1 hypothetical protein [Streptomyces sp. SID13726]
MNPLEEILEMARKFISGEDRSMEYVTSMEGFAVEHFMDSEVFEFLAEGMSLYRPWGGPPYWSERDMIQLLEDFVREFGTAG